MMSTPGFIIKYILYPDLPKEQITKADMETFDQVTHFVSTVYNRSHFTVLLFDLEAHQITVYDGLPCHLKKWQQAHISYILKKYGLQDYKDMPHVKVTKGADGEEVIKLLFSDLSAAPWLVAKDPELKQFDEINCGPIACMKVLEIYDVIPKNSVAAAPKMHPQGYRGIVMEYYKRFMQRYKPDMWCNVSQATLKKIAKEMQVKEDNTDSEDGEADCHGKEEQETRGESKAGTEAMWQSSS